MNGDCYKTAKNCDFGYKCYSEIMDVTLDYLCDYQQEILHLASPFIN